MLLERRADDRDCSGEIAEHELCADADDSEACALQLAITARVSGLPARMDAAIDFDDELDAGGYEISDEEPEDGHLTAK